MLLAAQAGQLEGTTAGMLVVLLILLALTGVWLWAVWRLFREGRWKKGVRETGLVALWLGLLVGGGWLLSTHIRRGRDVARRAIPEYCPQVRHDIQRGAGPLGAARSAVLQMQRVEPAIQTLDIDDLGRTLLRVCRERTGWGGFRVPTDTAGPDATDGTEAGTGPGAGLPGVPGG